MSSTDKRTNTRQQVNASAVVQVLGESEAAHSAPFPGTVIDASPNGMGIRVSRQVRAGQAIKVEIEDVMFLGEVAYCAPTPEGEDCFTIGVEIEQCLSGLSSLQQLIEGLREERRVLVQRQ